MTAKSYLFALALATTFCWAAWLAVIFRIDPTVAVNLDFLLFYGSLSLALIGTFALLGLLLRRALRPSDVLTGYQVSTAFRQAILFTILLVGSLSLLKLQLLNPLSAVLFVALLAVLEFIFLSNHHQPNEF